MPTPGTSANHHRLATVAAAAVVVAAAAATIVAAAAFVAVAAAAFAAVGVAAAARTAAAATGLGHPDVSQHVAGVLCHGGSSF